MDELITARKIAHYEKLVKGDHLLVHLLTAYPGLQIPSQFLSNPSLTLKLSLNFQGELKHDDKEISVYLKFSGQYEHCLIPWGAIWAMTDEKGESSTFLDLAAIPQAPETSEGKPPKANLKPVEIRALEGTAAERSNIKDSDVKDSGEKRARAVLRRVK